MKKQIPLILFALLFIIACSQSESAIQTAIAQTQAAFPTITASPSVTPSLTFTPKPTSTSTPTKTPTLTPTFTLAPGTLTKQAFFDEATQRSAAVTATVARQLAIRYATETAAMALYNKKLEYSWIEVRELVAYPDHHIGEKVIVQGYIFNIIDDQHMQMQIGDYPTEPIFVFMAEPYSGIYENDYIRVYGTVNGKQCGENAFGAEICQPLLIDAFWEPREGAQ